MHSSSSTKAPYPQCPPHFCAICRTSRVLHAQELTDLSALISSSRCSRAGKVGCPSSLLNWILTASWRPLRGAAC